jgi:hypothetical protein
MKYEIENSDGPSVRSLKEFFNSPEGQRSINKVHCLNEIEETIMQNIVNAIRILDVPGRIQMIKKYADQYDSDEYVLSERAKGYEPREPFFDALLQYARKYGSKRKLNDDDFCVEKYILKKEKVEVKLLIGQGSQVIVNFIEE